MLFRITHETVLTYTEAVTESVVEARMAPSSTEDQTALGYQLRIAPAAGTTSYRDGFGNRVDLFSILAPHRDIILRASSCVRTHRACGKERLARVEWPGDRPAAGEAIEYLRMSRLVAPSAELDAFRRDLPEPSGSIADVACDLIAAVGNRLIYEKKATTARTPVGEALALGRGVCQDYAHLFIAAARGLGLPARYVSGYVNQPGEIATHAWVQIWGGTRIGWVDVDPTQGQFVGDDHIVVAVGRDYSDVPPNRGLWRGQAKESIEVAVKVEPIDRVPPDWNELNNPSPRTDSAAGPALALSSSPLANINGNGNGNGNGLPFRRRSRQSGSNALSRAGYHHQQGQQQQTQSPLRVGMIPNFSNLKSLES